jgi:chemotaxis signal transduction protein
MTNELMHRPTSQNDQLLSVRSGGQEFALNIRVIREIRGWISSFTYRAANPHDHARRGSPNACRRSLMQTHVPHH